ncbi:hypothetical protein [Streptomyces sp. NPDC058308]|uniref:hypothetical protein n=1 Tax=Streptomyces sp. NPDC058308 TaxID=3346440 RepID=UPI0036EF5994
MNTPFNLDAWVKEARQEPFRFTLADSPFTMPSAGELDKRVLKSVNVSAPTPEDIESLLKAGLGDQWERFDELPLPLAALGELFRQWQQHEGVPVRESLASSDS